MANASTNRPLPDPSPDAVGMPRPWVRPAAAGRGFSLIELLVVVGVLALLVSLAVIGFRVVGGVMKSKSTGVTLENGQGLLAAYKLTNSVDSLLSDSMVGAMASAPANYRWLPPRNSDNTPNTAETWNVLTCQLLVPNYSYSGAAFPLITDPSLRVVRARLLQDETARVLKRLAQVPANKAAIDGMAADRITRVRFPADPATSLTPVFKSYDERPQADYPTSATGLIDGVSLLDGYGHPIYFVPGGGLVGVNVGYTGKGDKADTASYDRQNVTITAPDRQPFWASGGTDGDLSTGDDNVYSFER